MAKQVAEIPTGFTMPKKCNGFANPSRSDDGTVVTQFIGDDEVAIYGVNGAITATHRSGPRGILKLSPAVQQAKLLLIFDTTPEGYERKPIDQNNPPATIGSSQDPDKIRASGEIVQALAERLRRQGYSCEEGATFLCVSIPDPRIHASQLAWLYRWLHEIGEAYQRGEKPLGDIVPAKGEVRYNIEKLRSPRFPRSPAKYVRAGEDTAALVASLAKGVFPVGRRIIEEDHREFETALRRLLDRGRDKS